MKLVTIYNFQHLYRILCDKSYENIEFQDLHFDNPLKMVLVSNVLSLHLFPSHLQMDSSIWTNAWSNDFFSQCIRWLYDGHENGVRIERASLEEFLWDAVRGRSTQRIIAGWNRSRSRTTLATTGSREWSFGMRRHLRVGLTGAK